LSGQKHLKRDSLGRIQRLVRFHQQFLPCLQLRVRRC
jgi:hypothetical protein